MTAFIGRILWSFGSRSDWIRRVLDEEERRSINSARRILVVDDTAEIVRLMQINLERAGFKVDTASTVEEAQLRVNRNIPDVVVTDALMPGVDGFELLQRIRTDPGTADIPVVILSPWTKEGDIDYYFTKPFNPKELVALVERICRKL